MNYLLGHTPPPRNRLGTANDLPFDRYAGVSADRELAIALDKFRESGHAGAALDDPTDGATNAVGDPPPASRSAYEPDEATNRLRFWQSDVRRLLVLNEVLPLFRVASLGPDAVVLRLQRTKDELDLMLFQAPSLAKLCEQIPRVVDAARQREGRRQEILSQVDAVDVFFGAVVGIHPEQHPMTIELMDVVSRLVAGPLHVIKHLLDTPRPVELSPDVQPIILTPGHASFPGGHAAYAHAMATVLHLLLARPAPVGNRLRALAERIAGNRVIAGLHYPCDTRGGRRLGLVMGVLIWFLAVRDAHATSRIFTERDFEPDDAEICRGHLPLAGAEAETLAIPGTPGLAWLWHRAAAEWRSRTCVGCSSAAEGDSVTSAAP